MQGIFDGRPFGYVQCDIEVPEHLRDYFSNFPPIIKNTVVKWDDILNLMKQYAEEENIMVQPRRMLISSFILTIGRLITPLLLFYLKHGLVCKKIHRFVQYTSRKFLNNFVQSALDARGHGEVAAVTIKLIANSYYEYQIMDGSRHKMTMYLTKKKTHSAVNSRKFKRANTITDLLFEVELDKLEIEHRDPIIV